MLAVIVAVAAGPVSALTLQPGHYKLEWKIPRWNEAIIAITKPGPLTPIEPEHLVGIMGLKSSTPLWATVEGRTVIVDESAGDKTGYDTAYVLASYKPGDTVDLSNVLQLQLLNRGSLSISEERDSAVLDTALGSGESRLMRKAGIRVQVSMNRDPERGNVPEATVVTTFGNWFGKIASDEGDIKIQLIDKNANYTFNDVPTLDAETSSIAAGDSIVLRYDDDIPKSIPLGPVLSYAGKLYKITIPPTGESIDIQPFTGPTGVLGFETRDGKNGIVQTGESVMFLSTELGGVELKSGEQVTAPVGEYCSMPSVTFGARKKPGEPGFIATVKTNRVAKVGEGKTTIFTLGGSLSMIIDPDVDALEWTAGSQTRVKAVIFAGEDELTSLGLPEPKVTLMIRDAAGRAIGRAHPDMGLGNPRFFPVKVFNYLQPGQYWVNATFEPGEYAPGVTVAANKPVNLGAAK